MARVNAGTDLAKIIEGVSRVCIGESAGSLKSYAEELADSERECAEIALREQAGEAIVFS